MHRNHVVGQALYTGELVCTNHDKAGHALIQGATDTGKSQAIIAGKAEQDVMAGDRAVVLFLFKEDMPLLLSLARMARRHGVPFKFFSANSKRPTFVYNPLDQEHITDATKGERMQLIAQGYGLTAGGGRHSDFWEANAVEFARLVFGAKRPRSFAEARDYVRSKEGQREMDLSDRARDNMSHPIMVTNQIAEVAAANATEKLVPESVWKARITHKEMCTTPGIYVFMNSPFKQAVTGEALLHFAFLSHLAALESTPDRIPTSMYVDEVQRALGPAFATALEMARGLDVSLTLSHQTMGQLTLPDGREFAPTILTNAATKIFLPPYQDKPTTDVLAHIGGEINRLFYGRDGRGQLLERESPMPRFGVNELNDIARTPNVAIVVQRPGRDLAVFKHPVVTRFQFPVSLKEHEETMKDPWPESDGTVLASDIKPPPPPPKPTPGDRSTNPTLRRALGTGPQPVESPSARTSKTKTRTDRKRQRPDEAS